ncbi:MAG: hypothetical protein HZA37_00055 [Parcubacteria group bacterium]|nr:hypothetical protein [Parcubacteria group bacterium]
MEDQKHACGEECSIYGVNIHEPVTPEIVRDAIVKCFTVAHAEVLEELKEFTTVENQEAFEEMKRANVEALIRQFFKESGGDFDRPTKETVIATLGKLVDFSEKFRSPEIVKKHKDAISVIIGKL